MSVRSTAVFPEPFNDGADRWGNKAEALSRWTLALVAEALGIATPRKSTSCATSMAGAIAMADCCKSAFPNT